jgi:hypothetical protein
MFKKYFPILCFGLVPLWAQSLSIEPVGFGIHRSTGDIWFWEDTPLTLLGYGFQATTDFGEHWDLFLEVVGTQFFGHRGYPNPFSPEHGFSWKVHATDEEAEFSSDYTNMKLTYTSGDFQLFAGKFGESWGPAQHSLFLSEKSPSFPHFGFDWQVNPKWRFSFFHGELFSNIIDTLHSDLSITGTRRVFLDRFIAAHRVEWQPWESLTLAFSESVVYGGKSIETIYLMPFVLYFSAEHFLGDADNTQMHGDITWEPSPDLKLYAAMFMDDWEVLQTFEKPNRNHFGWQAGISKASLLKPEDKLIIEGSWTDHRIYRHRYIVNDYYNRVYPMGHWTGPHAQSLAATYAMPVKRLWFMARYMYAKRGELTQEMLDKQYRDIYHERFSGETDTRHHLALTVMANVWKKLWVELELSHVQWSHPDFNPKVPAPSNIGEIAKTSVNLGFYYNFNLPGYAISSIPGP